MKKVVLPIVSTSFATNVKIILVLWPLWWILGVEQFIPPLFLVFEIIRLIFQRKGRINLHPSVRWAALLAIWWAVPILWIERDYFDIFIKETATAWSQVLILLLFWNSLRTQRDWIRVGSGLLVFSAYQVLSSLLYISGVWKQSINSLLGKVLPGSLIQASEFFMSISTRNFGFDTIQKVLFPLRVSGFALNVGGLSAICLLLIPFLYWRLIIYSGVTKYYSENINMLRINHSMLWIKIWGSLLLFGLFITLVFTESRTAYLAFAIGFALYWMLRFKLFSIKNRPLFFSFIALSAALLIVSSYLVLDDVLDALQVSFVQARGGSWVTRIKVYQETIRLLGEHWVAGWGQSVRIEGLRTVFSAGSHSSYLGMLFQHGIVGLILYLGLWISIWRVIIQGLRFHHSDISSRYFWVMMAVAMLSFNVREAAESWWWDQTITMTLWTLWGLIITAPKFLWVKNDPILIKI